MMQGMMDGMSSMELVGLILLVVAVLIGAAAVKYLFFDKRRDH